MMKLTYEGKLYHVPDAPDSDIDIDAYKAELKSYEVDRDMALDVVNEYATKIDKLEKLLEEIQQR